MIRKVQKLNPIGVRVFGHYRALTQIALQPISYKNALIPELCCQSYCVLKNRTQGTLLLLLFSLTRAFMKDFCIDIQVDLNLDPSF